MSLTKVIEQEPAVRMPPVPQGWRVAHDFAFAVGGAERVSALLAREVAVDGSLVTLGGRPEVFAAAGLEQVDVRHPRLFTERHYRQSSLAMPLLALATRPIEGNLLASSYAFSHHLRATGKKVVYCHTPLRQVWSGAGMYTAGLPTPARRAAQVAISAMRRADRRVAHQASAYVANSAAVADRIRAFYGIEPAAVAHPPYDESFRVRDLPRGEHYVWAGRIVEPYKRLAPLLEAFRATPHRTLHVIGEGRDAARLRAAAPPNVTFLGSVDTERLAEAYCTARAVIFPSEDDFGLVPVEAMACGAPVIALGRGGALETVIDGATGVLFPESTPQDIRTAVDRFEHESWDEAKIVEHAITNFGQAHFVRVMREVLASV